MKKPLCLILAAAFLLLAAGCKNDTEFSSSAPTFSSSNASSDTQSETQSNISSNASSDSSSGGISFINPAAQVIAPAVLTDEQNYFCYSQLSARQKEIYLIMFSAASAMLEGAFRVGECEFLDIVAAFGALRADMPELFWLSGEYLYTKTILGYNVTFQSSDGKAKYLCSDELRADMALILEQKVSEIIEKIPAGASEYEKELFLYDYLCANTTYDENGKNAFTAYGALVEGRAVCEGYSRAMQLLLSQVGIESTLVAGEADGSGHMWNLVKLGKVWYHLDATWGDAYGKQETVTHGFFNLSDQKISKTHKIDPSLSLMDEAALKSGNGWNFALPDCNSLTDFYHSREGTILDDNIKQSAEVIKAKLSSAAAKGLEKIEFYIDSNEVDIVTKYGLNHCLSEVNKFSGKKLRIPSVTYVGNSAVVFIKYEGE